MRHGIQPHFWHKTTKVSILLCVFLVNSLTNDFAALLYSRIDPKYSSDGPLLLYTMCTHLHRNHLTSVESIKNKIRMMTLSEHKEVPLLVDRYVIRQPR
jgi:hypothetical protein